MSTKRFQEGETLMAASREQIPKVAVRWLEAVRVPLETLTMAALSPDVSDDEFVKMVEDFAASLPGLLETMDHSALAELMEGSMGAAMANGMVARQGDISRAKAGELFLAAGKGKKCGNSWISADKECRVNIGPALEGSEESMKATAKAAMKSLPTVLSHPDTGFEFQTGGNGIKKTLRQCKGAEDYTAAANLWEIFRDSTPLPPEPPRDGDPSIVAFHNFRTLVKIGKSARVAITTAIEWAPNNDPTKQKPTFKLFRLRRTKKGT